MKFVLQLLAFALPAAVCAAPAEGLRNPFWPQGYKGVTSPISAEPRPKPVVVPKPAANSARAELAKATAAKEAAEAAARAAAAREAAAREAAAKEAAAREVAAKKAAEEKAAAEKAAQEAEAERNREITPEAWKTARKALKIRKRQLRARLRPARHPRGRRPEAARDAGSCRGEAGQSAQGAMSFLSTRIED